MCRKVPHYRYEDFRNACARGKAAVVLVNPVLKDATAGFNLRTTKAVLDFVANDGLENREFVNSKKWENNPDKNNPIIVDAYEFTTISRRGYRH